MKLTSVLALGAATGMFFGGVYMLYNVSKADEAHYADVKRAFSSHFGSDTNMALRIILAHENSDITHYQMERANERVARARSMIETSDINRVYSVLGKPVGFELTLEDECLAADRLSKLDITNNDLGKRNNSN